MDHWCLSWFGHMRHRRIVAPTSAVFWAGMGTLRRPSSPERDSPWSFSLFFGEYDGVGRISGHCGGLHRVYFVKYFPRAERAFRWSSAPAFLHCSGRSSGSIFA